VDAVTKFHDKKESQSLAALEKRIEKLEKLVSALVSDGEFLKQRLAKVEVVKAGPQEPDIIADEQRPETE
jgi:hypothetical protein